MTESVFRPIYYSRDNAPVVVSTVVEDSYYLNYVQKVKLLSIPADDYTWKFTWPGGSITFTWKTTVLKPWNEIEIVPGVIIDCIEKAIEAFNNNYYFNRYFIVLPHDGTDVMHIKSKEIGSQFWALRIGDDSTTLTTEITEAGSSEDHKENYQLGITIYKLAENIISGQAVTKVLLSDQVAPVILNNENETEVEITFNIQNSIHSITHFTPPDQNQSAGKVASGHMVRFIPAVFEVYGDPPVVNEFEFKDAIHVLRGGSRVENQDAFEDFVQDYIIQENNSILTYSLTKNVTVIQEQYVYWMNIIDNLAVKLRVDFLMKDGSYLTQYFFNFSIPINEVLIMPVGIKNFPGIVGILSAEEYSFDDIEKYFASIVDQYTGALYCGIGQYTIEDSVFGEKYFLAETTCGGAELFRCIGDKSMGIEISKTEYQQFNVPSVYWQRRTTSQKLTEFIEFYECSTGNLSREQIQWYLNILLSENAYEIIYIDDAGLSLNGYRVPVRIEPGTFMISKDQRDGVYLFGFTFKYRRSYTEQSLGLNNNYF